MRTLALISILATLAVGPVAATPLADSFFSRGNTAYVGGDNSTDEDAAKANYQMAADNYKSAIEAGDISWAAYFNLGNACYKLGEYGNAVHSYERALAIDPVKPETAVNMAKARVAAALPAARPQGRVEEWGLRMPIKAWMWGGAIGIWALLASLVLPFLHGGHKLATITATVASAALCAVCAAGMLGWHLHARWHTVTTPDAPMFAAPDDKASQVRKLGDATSVNVIRTYDKWLFVRTEQKDEGWVLEKDAPSIWEK